MPSGVEEAALAFEILHAGISALAAGDIHYTGPSSEIGVTASGIPDNVRHSLRAVHHTSTIYEYHSSTIVAEAVSLKLECTVQYNGPEVQATFHFPADGMRSRLGDDVYVTVDNPLSLERMPAPSSWQAIGIAEYPVVYVPVNIFVDETWPTENTKVSFMLVLSGLYGFSKDGGSMYENYQLVHD